MMWSWCCYEMLGLMSNDRLSRLAGGDAVLGLASCGMVVLYSGLRFGTPPITGLEVVSQDFLGPAANLSSIVRPQALAPVTVTARLGGQQVEQGVAVTMFVTRDA